MQNININPQEDINEKKDMGVGKSIKYKCKT